MTRRSFHHQPEAARQRDLVAAMLDAIAELGLQGATVREVALRAAVTPGLIRWYFDSKENLVHIAYRSFLADMANASMAGIGEGSAAIRLARFVRASFTAPVADGRTLSIWAAFIGAVNADPAMAAIHREGYRSWRDMLEALIGELMLERGLGPHRIAVRRQAIAVNALVDGLWLEISLAGDDFADVDIVRVALDAVAAILGVPAESLTAESATAESPTA